VLEFAARRLEGRPVGFLLSLRTPSRNSAPLGLDRSLGDGRLERVGRRRTERGRAPSIDQGEAGAHVQPGRAAANPPRNSRQPVLRARARVVTPARGSAGGGRGAPVPDDVRALVAGGLRTLPAPTREMLLTASAMANPTVGGLRRAVRASSKQMLALLAGAEEARVLVVDGESVRFSHPLFASAIYAAASSDELREAQPAAGRSGREHRGAWHGIWRSAPRSPTVRSRPPLRRPRARFAGRAPRGPPSSSPSSRSGSPRRIDFGEHDRRALELAYYPSSRPATPNARGRSSSPSRNDQARSKPERSSTSRPSTTGAKEADLRVARCEQALAAAAGEPALEAACHADLAVYCDFDSDRCEQHARAALELLDAQGEAADPDALIDALLATTRASLLAGRGLPPDTIERALEAESRAEQSIHRSRVGPQLAQWLKYVDDFAGSRARLEQALSQSIAVGDESAMPNELMHLAQLECWSGNWPLASQYAAESVELAEHGGQSFGGPPAMRALIDAHLGNVEQARSVEKHLAGAEGTPLAVPLHRALGFLQLSLGDAVGAELHLSRALEIAEDFGIREPAVYRVTPT